MDKFRELLSSIPPEPRKTFIYDSKAQDAQIHSLTNKLKHLLLTQPVTKRLNDY
ncbi:hypothetical protein NTGHW29_150021 [Candidatus Nitrotoga sp. HW29]|nr:hypothetical protein NTGHW29_150021 [Candidatus Nitrotoga sp. HW29]